MDEYRYLPVWAIGSSLYDALIHNMDDDDKISNPFVENGLPKVQGEIAKLLRKSLDEAIDIVRDLNKKGYAATMDILGEFVESTDKANQIKDDYAQVIQRIAEYGLDSTISVKPTHLGLGLDDALGEANIMALAQSGKDYGVGVTIDMENSPYTSQTFDIYKRALSIHDNMGTVIQAYLYGDGDSSLLIPQFGWY